MSRSRFEERLSMLDPPDRAMVAWLRSRFWPEREPLRHAPDPKHALPRIAIRLAELASAVRARFGSPRDDIDVATLEKMRLMTLWETMEREITPHGLGLEAVLRSVIRWDIAVAWLSGDTDRSGERLAALAQDLVAGWRMHD